MEEIRKTPDREMRRNADGALLLIIGRLICLLIPVMTGLFHVLRAQLNQGLFLIVLSLVTGMVLFLLENSMAGRLGVSLRRLLALEFTAMCETPKESGWAVPWAYRLIPWGIGLVDVILVQDQ